MDRDAEGIEFATGIRLHEVGCAMDSVLTRQFGNLAMRRLPKLPCSVRTGASRMVSSKSDRFFGHRVVVRPSSNSRMARSPASLVFRRLGGSPTLA